MPAGNHAQVIAEAVQARHAAIHRERERLARRYAEILSLPPAGVDGAELLNICEVLGISDADVSADVSDLASIARAKAKMAQLQAEIEELRPRVLQARQAADAAAVKSVDESPALAAQRRVHRPLADAAYALADGLAQKEHAILSEDKSVKHFSSGIQYRGGWAFGRVKSGRIVPALRNVH